MIKNKKKIKIPDYTFCKMGANTYSFHFNITICRDFPSNVAQKRYFKMMKLRNNAVSGASHRFFPSLPFLVFPRILRVRPNCRARVSTNSEVI